MWKNLVMLVLAAAVVVLWKMRPGPVPGPLVPDSSPFGALLSEARANPALAGAAIGLCVLDARGEVVFEDQARTAFIPASSLKTLTTATALEKLGPDFRFVTELKSTAPMADGVIAGELVIVGGGDPMLSLADLKAWAAELKKKGLRQVGGVRGDGSFFRDSLYGDFWGWGDIGNGYGSGVSGLNVEHNRYTAVFAAGARVGDAAKLLRVVPEVPGIEWVNEVTTGAKESGDGVMIHGGERTARVFLRGTVPLGAQAFEVTGAVPDPVAFAAHLLREALKAEGIAVGQGSREAPPAAVSLLKHESPSLKDIVTSIHATSDNHETECVFRLLGLRAAKAPAEAIREHWRARGLEFTGLRLVDGSGLSRADFISPLDLARVQHFAATGPQGAVYRASLLTEGGLRWKGGAMSAVRSFTGYAMSRSGTEFRFAFMVNHYSDAKAVAELRQRITDALLAL